ncbi:MAG: hypothetical protein ABW139_04890 [Candidatus Thiodiazotropha sp. DIVDIV]
MIHFSARFHQSSVQSKNSAHASSGSSADSDEQIMDMGAPKKVNPLLWDLSNLQERRTLMESANTAETESSESPDSSTRNTSTQQSPSGLPLNQYKILDYSKYAQASNQAESASKQAPSTEHNSQINQSLSGSSSQLREQNSLSQITQQFQQRFQNSAEESTVFHDIMKKTFGDQYNQDKAETIRQQTLKGDFSWMPEIKLVNENQLLDLSGTQTGGQALGAYSESNDTVYLSRELVQTDSTQAEKILTEEVGHSIDTKVNLKDAQGDEGDIFSRQIHGESISTETLNELRQENDSGVIEVDGKKIEVEYGFNPLKSIKKAVKKVTRSVKKAVKGVARGVKKAVKGVARGVKKAVKGVARGVKKAFKGVARGVKKAFKGVARGVKKAVKGVARGIKKAVKGIARGVKNAVKKLAQSKVFQAIATIAQFVPIPVVAMVAKGINVAMSAYNVVQGVKNKSWGAVLGGVAGVAGGVSNFGKALGASASFVDKAASIAKHIGNASAAYNAIANKDFLAAASLASNYFSGNSNVTSAIQQAGKANQVYEAVKSGDYLGAIGVGSTLMQDFTGDNGDKILQTIGQNAGVLSNIDNAVKSGNYSAAVSILTEQYGDNLNLGIEERNKINQVTQAFQNVHHANQLIKSHNYADAAQLLLQTAEQHTTSPESKQRLIEASQSVDQLNNVVTAIKDGRYADSIMTAGDLMKRPIDDESRKLLTDIQTYAEDAQQLGEMIKNGATEEIIEAIKERMNEQVVITNILKNAA